MLEWLFNTEADPQIHIGSIGWEDEDEYFYFGTDSNDGHTLVRVQLFAGRNTTKPLNPSRAQGYKILCHIPDGTFRIPKKDTRCYVAIPPGMETVPGAGIILACVSKSPTTQFAKDRVVMNFGDDVHVVVKGKSVTMQDPDFRFVSVGTPRSGGTPGVQIHLPDGTGAGWQDGGVGIFCRAESLIQMKPSSIEMWQKTGDTSFLKMGGGEFWSYAPVNKVQGAGVYLGKAPTVLNTALWGATGIAGVASPSVFFSPV